MGGDVGHLYRVTSGVINNADVSTTTECVVGIANHTLSLKRVVLNVVGASLITIEEETSGTDLLVVSLGALATTTPLEFSPGQVATTTAGKGIFVDSDVGTGTTAYIECWVHPA